MNQEQALEEILRNTKIIETIETYASGKLVLDTLESSSQLKILIDAVVAQHDITSSIPLIKSSSLTNNDRSLFSALKKLPDLLVNKSCEGEKKVITESKAIVIGSVLLLIGIAVGFYYAKNNSSNADGKLKLPPKNKQPDYTQHHLLLIIPTRRLSFKLTKGEKLNNEQTKDLISNATRAYCYQENDPQGIEVNKKIDHSGQENIDFASDIKVFVHLEVKATSAITNKNIKRLSIIEQIDPTSGSTVSELGKLGSPRSILEFFEI